MTIDTMRSSGVHKSDAVRTQLKQLDSQLETLSTTFSQNIAKSVNYVTIAPTNAGMLAGIDGAFVASHTNASGHTIFSTHYTDYVPVMHSAENEALRRQMYRAFNRRAYPENSGILKQLLQARQDQAVALGYATSADLATKGEMAGNATRAESFLQGLMAEVISAGQTELLTLNQSVSGDGLDVFQPYNYGSQDV